MTEDDGRLLSVFPGSERLRYLIPFRDPQETIDYLAGIAEQHPSAVVVFGDDGEKFGTWPETHKHCLRRRLAAAVLRRPGGEPRLDPDAPRCPKRSINVPPLGKIYLPDCSYREMTEWALPAEQLVRVRARCGTTWSTTRAGRRSSGSCAAASGGTSR